MIKDSNNVGLAVLPRRIARRPEPAMWDLDELLTLEEAAALHWPEGPLTARSLRTAAEKGALGTVLIARKRLTSRRDILAMSLYRTVKRRPS
ncbi:hypothetical protein [Bradyrhizobium yuanmingense]|uniref:hypothetical protein n=1 Tax=Bradyrhizobium yuanmingense TaxID=108015 RepID=UPI0023B90565|nr:hypothetical protein [Bradyrhizobium yuanmingense]MDF0498257.1 hypothetical protein [Bradyrhizobium yuanmingense]